MAKLINTLISRQILQSYRKSAFFEVYGNRLNVLIDSGAFIEFRKNARRWSVEEYHNWLDVTLDLLDRYNVRVDGYMTLDAIGKRTRTRENYEKSLAAGYKPIPILTQGFNEDDFKLYTSTSKRIAVGSIAGMDNAAIQHLHHSMEMLKGCNLDIHLLGVDKHQIVDRYRPNSVDSTTWSGLHRHGKASYMRNLNTLEARIIFQNFANGIDFTPPLRMQLRKLGFDPELVAKQRLRIKNKHGFLFECFIAMNNRRYAHLLEQNFGTKYHFALLGNKIIDVLLIQSGVLIDDPLPCLGMIPSHKECESWFQQYVDLSGQYIRPPRELICNHV